MALASRMYLTQSFARRTGAPNGRTNGRSPSFAAVEWPDPPSEGRSPPPRGPVSILLRIFQPHAPPGPPGKEFFYPTGERRPPAVSIYTLAMEKTIADRVIEVLLKLSLIDPVQYIEVVDLFRWYWGDCFDLLLPDHRSERGTS